MMIKGHPCKQECPRRSGTCQATCPDLAVYEAARAEARAARDAERARRNLITDYVSDAINAGRRRHR